MIDSQKPGFIELYQAFYEFFAECLRKDDSPWTKIKLQMMSQFFDDRELFEVITPIISRIQSNPEDRRAIARAALWDAFMARHMGRVMDLFAARYDVRPAKYPPVSFQSTQADPPATSTLATGQVPPEPVPVPVQAGKPDGIKRITISKRHAVKG